MAFPFFVGISLACVAAGCLFDVLSEDERKKQKQMIERQRVYERRREREFDDWKNEQYSHIRYYEESEQLRLRREHEAAIRRERINLWREYLQEAELRRKEKYKQLEHLQKILEQSKEYRKQRNDLLRIREINRLINELTANQKNFEAYDRYLIAYTKRINYICLRGDVEPQPFDFLLPETFPYDGKIYHFVKKDLMTDNGLLSQTFVNDFKYVIEDFDLVSQYDDEEIIPLMCRFDWREFNASKIYRFVLSIAKGKFMEEVLCCPKAGFEAKVTKYLERGVELVFCNHLRLCLPKSKLLNATVMPPLKAKVCVYPIEWEQDLYSTPVVSENREDSFEEYCFDEIPFEITPKQEETVYKFFEENDLSTIEGEWKIAPFDEKSLPECSEFKLQLNNAIVLLAKINFDEDKFRLSFVKILDSSHFLKPEDIYFTADCTLLFVRTIDLVSMQKYSPEVFQHMDKLIFVAQDEFRNQLQIKNSRPGQQYFNKWATLLEKFIKYMECGKGGTWFCNVEIADIVKEPQISKIEQRFDIYLKQPQLLEEFVEHCSKYYGGGTYKGRLEFLVCLGENRTFSVNIMPNGESIALTLNTKDIELTEELEEKKEIVIYLKVLCVAESRQLEALRWFRSANLENKKLLSYALNGKNIVSEREPIQNLSFCNKDILKDDSQAKAVRNALAEKNIFLMQGPPGTGKTTVIREIVCQYVKKNPNAAILIVSQANVAVDNVLRGLQEVNINFIRCGNKEKIDESLQAYGFENIYAEYVKKLKTKIQKYPYNEVLKFWAQEINIDDDGKQFDVDLSEILLRSNNIVGATCVGLAQKRIGLDRMRYDLVIVDEAGKALVGEILIPYIRAKKIIIIGDHKQLPPVINPVMLDDSKLEWDERDVYGEELFNNTFFSRMFESAPDTNKCMLRIQYRMPEVIGNLVSQLFYNGKLANGQNTFDKKTYVFPKNITFIDCANTDSIESSEEGQSVKNFYEARYVAFLLKRIRAFVKSEQARIAVITPYKGQKRAIISCLVEEKFNMFENNVAVDTVDAFQGDEAEIVLYCTTRTKYPTKYFSDSKRINVALSRTKNELIIIGSLKYFQTYNREESVLPKIVEYVEQNGNVIGLPRSSEKLGADGQIRSAIVYTMRYMLKK